jgi:hypothetical protein
MQPGMKSEDDQIVATPVLAAALTVGMRIALSVFGALLAPHLVLNRELIETNAFTSNLLSRESGLVYAVLGIWQRFDTLWYIHIAQSGYDRPAAVVFYPVYPFLIRLLTPVFRDPLVSALVMATAGMFFALWGFQQLVRLDYTPTTAAQATILLAVWPGSFIFFAAYPESLLLAFTTWSIYKARQREWVYSAILAVIAALTKAAGVVVAIPLLVIAARERSRIGIVAAAGALLTSLIYQITMASGPNGMQNIYAKFWGTTTAAPWVAVSRAIHSALMGNEVAGLNIAALILFGGICVWPRVPLEYRLYAASLALMFVVKNTYAPLQSTIRYVLAIFPAFALFVEDLTNSTLFAVIMCLAFAANIALAWTFFEWMLII